MGIILSGKLGLIYEVRKCLLATALIVFCTGTTCVLGRSYGKFVFSVLYVNESMLLDSCG